MDLDLIQDWMSLLLRWAHIIAAISWIGSSFYFMWLDSSLKRRANMSSSVRGENWTVHGGGFYHTQKYMVAPDAMPDDLHWFRWESYATWMTGFGLLAVVYYLSASQYMIDPAVADIAPWQAICLSLLGIFGGWFLYHGLCASKLAERPSLMFAVLFIAIVAAAWAYGLVFAGRATFIQIGAMIATIMSGNVFLVIIPNQRIVVADLKAGRIPDAKYGAIAKLRSTHNNYLTIPVVFLMISNHYPMTFGHDYAWAVVALVLVVGGVVRNWFNMHEAGRTGAEISWQWPVAALLVAAMAALVAWKPKGDIGKDMDLSDAAAMTIVQKHCTGCHAAAPTYEGFDEAPGGVRLETVDDVKRHRPAVMAQSVRSRNMPLGNETGMSDEERAKLGAWLVSATE